MCSKASVPIVHMVGQSLAIATERVQRTAAPTLPTRDSRELGKCISQPCLHRPLAAPSVSNGGSLEIPCGVPVSRPCRMASVDKSLGSSVARAPCQAASLQVHSGTVNSASTFPYQAQRVPYPVRTKSPTASRHDDLTLIKGLRNSKPQQVQDTIVLERQAVLERHYCNLAERIQSQETILSSIAWSLKELSSKFEYFNNKCCGTSGSITYEQSRPDSQNAKGLVKIQPPSSMCVAQQSNGPSSTSDNQSATSDSDDNKLILRVAMVLQEVVSDVVCLKMENVRIVQQVQKLNQNRSKPDKILGCGSVKQGLETQQTDGVLATGVKDEEEADELKALLKLADMQNQASAGEAKNQFHGESVSRMDVHRVVDQCTARVQKALERARGINMHTGVGFN